MFFRLMPDEGIELKRYETDGTDYVEVWSINSSYRT